MGSQSPLLAIPQELRDMIYDHLFTSNSPILIWGTSMPTAISTIPGVGLLRVCKQLHSETKSLMYSKNTFLLNFEFGESCPKLLRALRNVVHDYPQPWGLDTGDGVFWFMEKRHFPIQKIRSLKVEFDGPDTLERDPNMPVQLAKHLHKYLQSCINKCTNLKHLHIELVGWVAPERKLFCTDLLLAKFWDIRCDAAITVKAPEAFRRGSIEFTGSYEKRLREHDLWYGQTLGDELGPEVDQHYEARIEYMLSKWTEKTVRWI